MPSRQLRDKYPPQKTSNAKPRTNWKSYLECLYCNAPVGKPCRNMKTSPMYTEYTQLPHAGRRRTTAAD